MVDDSAISRMTSGLRAEKRSIDNTLSSRTIDGFDMQNGHTPQIPDIVTF
jgi:hypothetical protein